MTDPAGGRLGADGERDGGTYRPAAERPGDGRPCRYVYHCPLRWSDLDAYGHINNARFLTLYEEARVALMFVGGRACGLGSFEDGVVISRHEIEYLRPVDYSTERATAGRAPTVRIEMWVEELRPSRFTIGYELFDSGVLAGRARSVLVPYDLERQRPRRLTADERAFLQPYVHGSSGGGARTRDERR